MIERDLRGWLDMINKIEPIKVIKGAHWDLEIGAVTKLAQFKARQVFPRSIPALMFDEIAGYPPGYRVLVDPLDSLKRLAATLGFPPDLKPMEFVRTYRKIQKEMKPLPPEPVAKGPVEENVDDGSRVDLFKFPTPKWHELDGGRYIGTGCVFITQDPEEGWVNLGTYRAVIHDRASLGLWIAPGQHGIIHMQKYFQQGRPCPMAISVGHHPLITMVGSTALPWGQSEYDYLGGLQGEPVNVIRGKYTGLPIPADAEIVLEGECLPGETREEGPFGEWTGYYGRAASPQPVMRVKAIMYRSDPIMTGNPPVRGGRLCTNLVCPATIWEELDQAGVPDVQGVWCNQAAGSHLIIVVSIKQRYPGHARQAGLVATACHSGARLGRITIVVDEDIDPSDTADVLWAVATRCDPERSVEILRRFWTSPIDTAIPRGARYNSRIILDACRPYEWKDQFAKVVEVSPELKAKAWARWGKELNELLG